MGILGAFLAGLIRIQRTWPTTQFPLLESIFPVGYEGGFMKPEFYISLVTMHGTIMIFFFISLVLVSGFGNYLMPLQVGAQGHGLSRSSTCSRTGRSCPAILMLRSRSSSRAAPRARAGPPTRRFRAVPAAAPGSGLGQTLWLLAMALFIVSFTMGGLNYVTTIFNLRAKGMSMLRMPLTVWSLLIASIIGLLAFPPLTAAAIMLLFDRHLGTSFYLPEGLYIAGQVLPQPGGEPAALAAPVLVSRPPRGLRPDPARARHHLRRARPVRPPAGLRLPHDGLLPARPSPCSAWSSGATTCS